MDYLSFMFNNIDFCNKKILDAATGAGGNTLNIAREVERVGGTGRIVSVDIDSRSFEYARQRLGEMTKWVDFVQADMATLPFAEGCFDIIVSTATLCAVNSKPLRAVQALQEFWRVLKPGGWCIIKEEYPLWDEPDQRFEVQHKRWQTYKGVCELAQAPHFHEIEPLDLINVLKLVGFNILEWDRFEGFLLNEITMKEFYKDINMLVQTLDSRQLRVALAAEIQNVKSLFASKGGEFPPQYVIRCKKQAP